jgi:hypothetical protein
LREIKGAVGQKISTGHIADDGIVVCKGGDFIRDFAVDWSLALLEKARRSRIGFEIDAYATVFAKEIVGSKRQLAG